MPYGLERWRAEIGLFICSSRCCVRHASFSLTDIFIAITSLLKLISLMFECILILYLNVYHMDYVFYFTFNSLTSGSNHFWKNS